MVTTTLDRLMICKCMPGMVSIIYTLACVVLISACSASAEFSTPFPDKAQTALLQGDWSGVRAALEDSDIPELDSICLITLAHAYQATNHAIAATAIFESLNDEDLQSWYAWTDGLVANNRGNAPALFLKADALCRMGEFEEATGLLDRCIEIDDEFGMAYALRGLVKTLIEFGPSENNLDSLAVDDALAEIISRSQGSGPPDTEASLDLQKATVLMPDSSFAWTALGYYHLRAKWPEQAHEAYTTALDLDSSNGEAYMGRAVASFALGEFEEADADFQVSAVMNPRLEELSSTNRPRLVTAIRRFMTEAEKYRDGFVPRAPLQTQYRIEEIFVHTLDGDFPVLVVQIDGPELETVLRDVYDSIRDILEGDDFKPLFYYLNCSEIPSEIKPVVAEMALKAGDDLVVIFNDPWTRGAISRDPFDNTPVSFQRAMTHLQELTVVSPLIWREISGQSPDVFATAESADALTGQDTPPIAEMLDAFDVTPDKPLFDNVLLAVTSPADMRHTDDIPLSELFDRLGNNTTVITFPGSSISREIYDAVEEFDDLTVLEVPILRDQLSRPVINDRYTNHIIELGAAFLRQESPEVIDSIIDSSPYFSSDLERIEAERYSDLGIDRYTFLQFDRHMDQLGYLDIPDPTKSEELIDVERPERPQNEIQLNPWMDLTNAFGRSGATFYAQSDPSWDDELMAEAARLKIEDIETRDVYLISDSLESFTNARRFASTLSDQDLNVQLLTTCDETDLIDAFPDIQTIDIEFLSPKDDFYLNQAFGKMDDLSPTRPALILGFRDLISTTRVETTPIEILPIEPIYNDPAMNDMLRVIPFEQNRYFVAFDGPDEIEGLSAMFDRIPVETGITNRVAFIDMDSLWSRVAALHSWERIGAESMRVDRGLFNDYGLQRTLSGPNVVAFDDKVPELVFERIDNIADDMFEDWEIPPRIQSVIDEHHDGVLPQPIIGCRPEDLYYTSIYMYGKIISTSARIQIAIYGLGSPVMNVLLDGWDSGFDGILSRIEGGSVVERTFDNVGRPIELILAVVGGAKAVDALSRPGEYLERLAEMSGPELVPEIYGKAGDINGLWDLGTRPRIEDTTGFRWERPVLGISYISGIGSDGPGHRIEYESFSAQVFRVGTSGPNRNVENGRLVGYDAECNRIDIFTITNTRTRETRNPMGNEFWEHFNSLPEDQKADFYRNETRRYLDEHPDYIDEYKIEKPVVVLEDFDRNSHQRYPVENQTNYDSLAFEEIEVEEIEVEEIEERTIFLPPGGPPPPPPPSGGLPGHPGGISTKEFAQMWADNSDWPFWVVAPGWYGDPVNLMFRED